ncbi:MAG: DUF3617 domain-containing protein [Acidobacteriaceae bacterium]
MRKLRALRVLPMLYAVATLAQQSAVDFKPGAWQIDSVTTMADGRTVSSLTNLCAKVQADFWKVAQEGLQCDPPKVTQVQDGSRVRVVCIYSLDSLNSRIEYDVIEKLSDDGTSFTANGTSKTNTTYTGLPPKVTSVQLQATAHRVGPCK